MINALRKTLFSLIPLHLKIMAAAQTFAFKGIEIFYSTSSADVGYHRKCFNLQRLLEAQIGTGGPKSNINVETNSRLDVLRFYSQPDRPCWHKVEKMSSEEKQDLFSRADIDRTKLKGSPYPLIFKDGAYLGNWDYIVEVNDDGNFDKLFDFNPNLTAVNPNKEALPFEESSAVLTWAPQVSV